VITASVPAGGLAVAEDQAAVVGLGDLAREDEADARASGLVVKNGTNRFAVSATPGPSSSTTITTFVAGERPGDADAAAVSALASIALRTRLIRSWSS